jgi:hypothetical protein
LSCLSAYPLTNPTIRKANGWHQPEKIMKPIKNERVFSPVFVFVISALLIVIFPDLWGQDLVPPALEIPLYYGNNMFHR